MPNFFLSHKRVKVAGHMLAGPADGGDRGLPGLINARTRESGLWRIPKNDGGNKKRPGFRGVSDFS
jgi:hypothetical protein